MQHTHMIDEAIAMYGERVASGLIEDGAKLTDMQVAGSEIFRQAARDYACMYEGENPFMLDMRSNLERGRSRSLAQVRGIINCLLAEARAEQREQERALEAERKSITKSQIIDIHTVVRTLGWDDAEYRDVLQGRYGVDTCKALCEAQAAEF